MARSLEGKKFFVNYNNGVTAITPEEILRNADLRWQISEQIRNGLGSNMSYERRMEFADAVGKGIEHIPTTPVFTFVDVDRKSKSPWFSANNHVLDALVVWIEVEGGTVEGGGGYVPFSNGAEFGLHGDEAMTDELRYVTTEEQFRATFSISRSEVESWYATRGKCHATGSML